MNHAIAITIVSSDSKDPIGGYHLSIDKSGHGSIGLGREGIAYLNGPNKAPKFRRFSNQPHQPEEPVNIIDILKEYAFIQNSSRLNPMASNYSDKRRKLVLRFDKTP